MVKAIIFDFIGVITNDIMPIICKKISKTFGLDFNFIIKTLEKILVEYQKGKDPRDFWMRVTKSLKIKSSPHELERLWMKTYKANTKPNKKMMKVVRKLKNSGYAVALLSNLIRIHADYSTSANAFKEFSPAIISCYVKLRKPEEEIYKLVLDELGLKAGECVFIDNRKDYLKPAEKLGIKTILFKSPQKLEDDLEKLL